MKAEPYTRVKNANPVEFQGIAPQAGIAREKECAGRWRVLTGGASQAWRCELFTNVIGGERRDFTGYVADVAADPPLSILRSARHPQRTSPEKVDWQLAGQEAMKA